MSPRPKRTRILKEPPSFKGFIPIEGEQDTKSAIVLHFEEFEALILSDYDSLNQEAAAKLLQVSRPTYTRIYSIARKKIATALTNNLPIIVHGGQVEFDTLWYECSSCNCVFKTEDELIKNCPVCGSDEILLIQEAGIDRPYRGRRKRVAHPAQDMCICPKCDYEVVHEPGKPCNSILCPQCDIRMLRKGSNHHLLVLKKRQNNINHE